MRRTVILGLLVLGMAPVIGQTRSDWATFNERRLEINRRGMVVLGSWAAGNIVTGLALAGNSDREMRAFHRMNAGWNGVNLAIAAFGYRQARREDPSQGPYETVRAQSGIENLLLLNAGLDLAWMAGGAWMIERGIRDGGDDGARLRGFGRSIVLQGAFLFVFDAALFAIHRRHGTRLEGLLPALDPIGGRIGLTLRW